MLSNSLVSLLTVSLAYVASANAHGYVTGVLVGGVDWYPGYVPGSSTESIIRKIPDFGPVRDLSLIDIQCNGNSAAGIIGSEPAPIFATVAAGETVKIHWDPEWPQSHAGPVISYLARAPNDDVTTFVPGTDAVWFKVAQEGKTGSGSSGQWASTYGFQRNNFTATVTIPENIRPGQYILRHEIMALHTAYTYPGVQVHPSCIQLEITGSGNAFPTKFVSFPGEYTSKTPGIIYDLFISPGVYPIPGPPVWTGGN